MRFRKGHGAQNDFVLLTDEANDIELSESTVRALTDRHAGIGGDGVIRAVPTSLTAHTGLLNEAPNAIWFMDYRNADGTIAEMCGNGIRVFVAYLVAEGLVELTVGGSIDIATRAGIRSVTRADVGEYRVDMGKWAYLHDQGMRDIRVISDGLPQHGTSGIGISMGNPHVVAPVATSAELERLSLALPPRLEPSPAGGANVEFVLAQGEREGVGYARMRVFERGVGETRSCGTGFCAAAAALRVWSGSEAPSIWRMQAPGGEVVVRFSADERVSLTGPAELVAEGTTDLVVL